MGRRHRIILTSFTTFLVLFIFSSTVLQQAEASSNSASGIATTWHSSSKHSRLNTFFLKGAFFPREPRLEDTQPISGFAPAGIASYGSDGIIQTNGVKGITTIDGINLGYFSAEIINNSQAIPYVGTKNGSLQENAVLWLGNLGTYWTQNVLSITQSGPSSYILQLINNIWNFTSVSSNINQNAIHGTGSVQCETLNGIKSCAYITIDPTLFHVTAPFTVSLTMSLSNSGTGSASVLFSYQIQDSIGDNFSGQYDNAILFPANPRIPSYFQIGGESPVSESLGGGTTLTLPSDLEFVFGGPGGGSSVFVNSISATQELLYSNAAGSYVSVPDAFSAGSDTGEQASGISAIANLANQTLPSADLSSGVVSATQLWPVPITFQIEASSDFTNNTLLIQGQSLYSSESASNVTVHPAPNLTIRDSLSGSSSITNENGVFYFPFKVTQKGTYQDTIDFPGSVVFEKSSINLQIAVSSINVTGASSGLIVMLINGTQVASQNQTTILVPVIQGTTLVLTFQNMTNSGNYQEHFQGFSTGQSKIILNGNSAVAVTASFTSATPIAPASSSQLLIYAIIGLLSVVAGIFVGYILRSLRLKSNSSAPAIT